MATTFRCLIIDDESPAHKALISHIAKFPELHYSGSAYSGKEALKMLNEKQFDIIFLDINMPVLSGIELMELQPIRPLTIITTAYSDFALSAYENDAVDYLLKPVSLERFTKAIEKAKALFKGYALEKQTGSNKEDVLSCKVNGETVNIALSEIIYIESTGNYLKIYCSKIKTPLIIYGTLLSILSEIKNKNFIQIHRSFIVNATFITKLDQTHLLVHGETQIPIGRKYKILLSQ